jgi:transposase
MDKREQEHRRRGSRSTPSERVQRRFVGIDVAAERHGVAVALIAAAAGSVGRHHGEAYRIQVRYTCEDLEVLRRRLRDLERDIDRLLGQHEIGRLLTTIGGIGSQTAARLVATFGDFSSFPSARAVASSVGAVPALKQSGKRTFQRASLTPIGAAHLRTRLWMPVLTAVRTNAWLGAYYERLIARGKLPKVALAAMRKLLHAVSAWPLIVVPSWPISLPRRPAREKVA